MQHIIYKCPIDIIDITTVTVSEGAKVLDAQVQNGQLVLWILNPWDAPQVERQFRVYTTGYVIKGNLGTYIATFQLDRFVGHVFEITQKGEH